MDELKACPFCGSSNIQPAPLSDYEWYRCNDCDALSGCGGATGWNTRPLEDALQAEIERMREAQRWIPVSERLPEDFDRVLSYDSRQRQVDIAHLVTGKWHYDDDAFPYKNSDLTHWMPLPQPPQEA